MAAIKKIGDKYFLCKKKRGIYRGNLIIQDKWTPLFRVRASNGKKGGVIPMSNNITFPEHFVGKKIMFKLVIVDGNA